MESERIDGVFNRNSLPLVTTTHENKTMVNIPKRHIICVDDDSVGLQIRGELFEELGYSVVLCNSPLTALSCDLSRFDLGVLDFQMPELDGRELLLRMRAAGAKFPVILLTGYLGCLSYEDRVLFTHCIEKGEPVRSLLDTIAKLLDPDQLNDCGT